MATFIAGPGTLCLMSFGGDAARSPAGFLIARRAGDDFAFEASGEPLWGRVRQRLGDLGRELLAAGALSPDQGPAFVVRCGRDTMTQADLDNGRLVAEIELVPAQPVLRILVVLALRDGQPILALRAAA